MFRRLFRNQSGQNLVLLAGAMLMLFAVLAVAIDMGHIYLERRKMQNAADAAALAGADELCFGSGNFGTASAKAYEYADRNLDPDPESVSIDPDTWVVSVTTNETVNNFVAGIIGIPTSPVRASAAAACGTANVACGLWPAAFNIDEWEHLAGGSCDPVTGLGESFYVWNGSNDNQDPNCSSATNFADLAPEECLCDSDGDGIRDVMASESRAWLDFSDVVNPLYPGCAQSGCGTSELSCWIQTSNPAPVRIPACIGGDTGVKAGAKDEVDARAGDFVSIPLYDHDVDNNGIPDPACVSSTCNDPFWITEFGCVQVVQWHHQKFLELTCKDRNGNPTTWDGDKLIEVTVACGNQCVSECGSTTGGPPSPTGVNAVSLIQ